MRAESDRIKADPSKSFFIYMLTRDIGIVDCILDLIDNSIHSLLRSTGVDVMRGLLSGHGTPFIGHPKISIEYANDHFRIVDNCGGISVQEAANEVFLFGKPRADTQHFGLGVYGIGMKRAFFKLGRQICLKSKTNDEHFRVDINVDTWEDNEDNWDFEFTEQGKRTPTKKPTSGTEIRITKINRAVAQRLRLSAFATELVNRIAATYSLFIINGVEISINGQVIEATLPEIAQSKEILPVRQTLKHDGVNILIMAGVTEFSDRKPRGWYIFCNGRMVVEADKTSLTGWGEGLPQFHSKYNHFVGYVYFKSKDISKLPWTTTKRGVEKESPVYQSVLKEMERQGRPILSFLSAMYPGDLDPEGVVERETLRRAKGVTVDKISRSDRSFAVKTKKTAKAELVTVKYSRPKQDIEKVRLRLRKPKLAAKKIGEITFDYYVERECE